MTEVNSRDLIDRLIAEADKLIGELSSELKRAVEEVKKLRELKGVELL